MFSFNKITIKWPHFSVEFAKAFPFVSRKRAFFSLERIHFRFIHSVVRNSDWSNWVEPTSCFRTRWKIFLRDNQTENGPVVDRTTSHRLKQTEIFPILRIIYRGVVGAAAFFLFCFAWFAATCRWLLTFDLHIDSLTCFDWSLRNGSCT